MSAGEHLAVGEDFDLRGRPAFAAIAHLDRNIDGLEEAAEATEVSCFSVGNVDERNMAFVAEKVAATRGGHRQARKPRRDHVPRKGSVAGDD